MLFCNVREGLSSDRYEDLLLSTLGYLFSFLVHCDMEHCNKINYGSNDKQSFFYFSSDKKSR